MRKITFFIKDPLKLIRPLGERKFLTWMSDKHYLKLVYLAEIGKKLNLQNPQTYNEKLQWLKIYNRRPEYVRYVDKFKVRQYITDTIGDKYLVPLLGVFNDVEEINWSELPCRFVLKCTHGSGSNIICNNKSLLDIREAKRKLNNWMNKNWFWFGREWPYKNVRPRIICEEFITKTDTPPMDYKVLCFNGKAKLTQVHTDRHGNHKQDFYNLQWTKMNISQGNPSDTQIKKPVCYDEMIKLSEKLAENIPHVRIDWYVVQDRLYFGEITFFDGSGFTPFDDEESDLLMGSWIGLTKYPPS